MNSLTRLIGFQLRHIPPVAEWEEGDLQPSLSDGIQRIINDELLICLLSPRLSASKLK